MDRWKELVERFALDPPVSVPEPPTSGRSWPLQSWARYIQSGPPLEDNIDWQRPLTFLLRGHAYLCAAASWTQLSALACKLACLWVTGIAVCGDKDMSTLATIWTKNLASVRSFCFASVFVLIS